MSKMLGILVLLVSCTTVHKPFPISKIPTAITNKRLTYCDLSWQSYFEKSFVDDECDSLLFTSLRGIGCNDIDIGNFEGAPGQWFRNPEHDCLARRESDSDISKDMLLGLATYLWWARDEKRTDDVIEYGLTHHWVMGKADGFCKRFTKCLMAPELIHNFYNMRSRMKSGKLYSKQLDYVADVVFGFITRAPQKGYLAHLEVLHILLNGSIYGYVTHSEYLELRALAAKQPHNALFQAAWHLYSDGDQSTATALLMDETKFPADAIPTNKNYCAHYLYERDEDQKDWVPCDRVEPHSGTDLIFAASVIDQTYMRGRDDSE